VSDRELLALMAAIIFEPPTFDEERESSTARPRQRAEAVEDAKAILELAVCQRLRSDPDGGL
jgi:hypothetical protein